jgi:hypothetical protein
MFGGLEIKGESSEKNKQVEQDPPTKPPYPVGHSTSPHDEEDDNDGPHAATSATAVPVTTSVQSGFSFLSSSRTSSSSSAVNAVAAPPAASVSSSAFGFLAAPAAAAAAAADPSSTDVKHKEEDHDEPVKGKEEREEGGANRKETKEEPMGDSKDFKVKAEDSILSSVLRPSEPMVSSGFSFLSATSTTAAAASDAAEGQDLKPTSTVPAKNVEDEKSSTSHSMFSMLQVKTNKDTSSTTKDPPIMSQSNSSYNDILSLSTPSQPISSASSSAAAVAATSEPTGSGIVFGGAAAKPKTMVKKRSRTKKIGAAAAAGFGSSVTLTTSGNGSMGVTTTTRTSNGNVEDGTTTMESVPIKDKENGDSNNNEEDVRAALAHEANEAISRAEEFLSSKQSLSSSSNVPMSFSTGRYSDMKNAVEEDYGEEVSSSTVGEYGIRKDGEYHGSDGKRGHNSNEMDDYQRAKAAAQEAMKRMQVSVPFLYLRHLYCPRLLPREELGLGVELVDFSRGIWVVQMKRNKKIMHLLLDNP